MSEGGAVSGSGAGAGAPASERAVPWLARLEDVERRLADHAQAPKPSGLTDPDPPTGERWDAGQVWAHLAEFLPYWMAEFDKVVGAAPGEPVVFGRTKADPHRIAAIEQRRHEDPPALMAEVRAHAAAWRSWLAALADPGWDRVGRHPTLGDMDVPTMLGHFVVGHLEEHADQLDTLALCARD